MADLNMALSPFDCFKRPQPSTPRNTSVIVRDYLHEDSLLWSVPRKEVVKLRFAHIQNPLNSKWALWYITEEDKVRSWYDRLQLAVCIKNIEQFWALYAFVLRPYELPTTSAYCLFKDGIRPVWTDKSNINGGQWAISILKSQDEFLNGKSDHIKKLSKYWKTFLIALAGDQLEGYTEFICGAVITIDHDKDEVALWISDVSNDKSTGIGNILKQLLKLANDENLKFEKHPLTISPVLTVYGLSQLNFNCERVFNLMCLYGDCLKVLFSRDGTCMIQMRNGEQAQNVIDHLSACKVFGKEISFVSMRKTMPGGFSSFADYSDSPHLRFSYQENLWKVLLQKPTYSLIFLNAPAAMTTSRIRKIFEKHGIRPKQSSIKEKNHLTSSGFVIFSTVEEAIKALIFCNHTSIVEAYQKNAYTLQLGFATTD